MNSELTTLNNSTKADLWKKMGVELEIEGVPKKEISTIVRKDIEDKLYHSESAELKEFTPRQDYKWHNGYYWRVMKQCNYTNPEMARNVDPLRDQENSSIYTQNNTMVELCYELMGICRTIKEKSKDPDINLEKTFGSKVMKEFYRQQKAVIFNIQNAINHKTKIPKNTEIFLLEIMATAQASINKIGEKFMEENLKRLQEQRTISVRTGKPVPFITLKQASKFKNGDKVSKQFLLYPKTRDTAIYLEYDGVKCECSSLRVRDGNCFDCEKVHPISHVSKCRYCHIPLYKERLLHIAKTGNCENCNCEVDLPAELVEYARS